MPRRTLAGSLVSESGHTVQEFLAGRVCLAPTAAQITATMRQVAAYHTALRSVPSPASLRSGRGLWDRVASAEYLVRELPRLLGDPRPWPGPAPPPGSADAAPAVGAVRNSLPRMRGLPRQLVHGDIGPDNVLMDGDEVHAIIDFTPHHEPVLFALVTAVYWYHVYGHDRLDLDAIRASLAATASRRPWTDLEAALWPAMLAREALRRLATPLAIVAENPAGAPPAIGPRDQAVRSVMRAWPSLAGLLPADRTSAE